MPAAADQVALVEMEQIMQEEVYGFLRLVDGEESYAVEIVIDHMTSRREQQSKCTYGQHDF